MLDEVVEAFVDIQRRFPLEALGDAVRAEDRDFGGDFGDALSISVFFERQVAQEFQPFGGTAPGDDRRAGFVEVLLGSFERVFVQVALLIVESDVLRHVEAGDAFGKTFLEAVAAKLAVGDDGTTMSFLLGDDIADRIVLRLRQLRLRRLAAIVTGKDVFQWRWTDQAADMIDAESV